jgi:Uncharacterized conserved protein
MEEKVLEKVRELGQAISDSQTMKKAKDAELAQMVNSEAQQLISEYQENHDKWTSEAKEGGLTKEKLDAVREKIDSEYEKVAAHPVISEYLACKKELDTMISDVNSILNFYITGEEAQEGCSGGCSSCSGCSH